MKLGSVIPDSNLLEQFEGVEAGLRKIQKIGRVGQYGFLFTAVLQIVFEAFEAGILPTPAPGSTAARAITAIRIASLLILPVFLLLFTWSKFWLRQSREPFRYTCSIEPITPLPHSPKLRESAWLANDLEEMLSQRIDRIRFVRSDADASASGKDDSHIDIGGTYVIRAKDDAEETLVLEIMPNVGIGRGKARKLAYPVSYPPDPTPLNRLRRRDGDDDEFKLTHSEYKALLERVYSSVATEIYQQIQTDVAGKIELMPTRFLRALALFHEAEDYGSSNTLHGYAEAASLYSASAQLFSPSLKPLPVSPLRRFFAKLTRRIISVARRAMVWCAPMRLKFARRDIMCARALTGYVNMLLYSRILATLSGQKTNPAYEAQRAAQDALACFDRLPLDAQGCREAMFDAHVSLALAYYYMGKREEAETELDTARSKDPTRDRDIRFQMVRSVLAPREKQAFRHLLNLAPRWETAQWSVAYEAERQWRARPVFETSLAEIPIREYQNVIDLNPGNVSAWANRGYLFWLLERCDEAKGSFRAGRDYKQIKHETFVAELDYGLARIAAEQGELEQAYCYQETAVSDLIAPTTSVGDFRAYHFDLVGDAVLNRFERYRRDVEKHLADATRTKGLSSRILNSVYAFVLTDYGECCYFHYLRTADSRSLDKAERAFELASLFDPENPLALFNLRQLRVPDLPSPEKLDTLRRQVTEAKPYDQKIRELHPYWTEGMLREVERNALEAFIARRDAAQSTGALAQEHTRNAIALEKKVTERIRALVPHDWLWTIDGDFNWEAIRNKDPLNERRWEKQFNDIHTSALMTYVFTLLLSPSENKNVFSLVAHMRSLFALENYRVLKRLQDLSKNGPQTTHTDADLNMRVALERWRTDDPYSFNNLWSIAANSFTDYERMEKFLDAAGRPYLSGSLYHWLGDDQLLGIARRARRKRELLEAVAKRMQRILDDEKVGTSRFEASANPQLVDALKLLEEILLEEFEGNGIDKDEINRLQEQVERILEPVGKTLDWVRELRILGTRPTGEFWDETLPNSKQRLDQLLERYLKMEKQCVEGAINALTRAVTASDDPATLWTISTQLAKFGFFEPALEATTKAAQADADRSEVALDFEKLNQAVRMLSSTAAGEYSKQFGEFLKLYRQPPVRSRSKVEYLRRECALLAMLEKFDSGSNAFLEMKQFERRRRAAIAAEVGELTLGDELESETADRLATGRVAFRKWLDVELQTHAADPEEVVDCRVAQVTLTRDERRDVRNGMQIIPGAQSLDFRPLVTPLAIEYETNLLGGDDSPSLKTLSETIFPKMQERIREDTGVRIPKVRTRSNDTDMLPGQYLIMVDEIPLVIGTAYPDKVFVRSSQRTTSQQSYYGLARFALPVDGEWREPEKDRGYGYDQTGVWNHLAYIARHIEHVVRLNIVRFFGLQETYNMLGECLETALSPEVAQHIRAIRDDHRLLRRTSRQLQELLDDRVPLTQPERLAAALMASHRTEDPVDSRRVLRDSLREQLWGNDGEYVHFKLSDSITAILAAKSSPGERLVLSPEDLQEFFSAVRTELDGNGQRPAIVTSGERLRYIVRYLIRDEWREVPVLADYELMGPISYTNLPVISLE